MAGGGDDTVADGIPATEAHLSLNDGIYVDTAGNVYFSDRHPRRVRKVSTDIPITTIAGPGSSGYDGDGGPATEARFGRPGDVFGDAFGNLYSPDLTDCPPISPDGLRLRFVHP